MTRFFLLMVLAYAQLAEAAATLYGTTTVSLLTPWATQGANGGCEKTSATTPWDYSFFLMNNSAPAGATSEGFIPTSTAPPCIWQRTGNQYLFFVSKPLSSSFTISGNLSAVCAGFETNASMNLGCDILVYKWNGRRGGIGGLVWDSGDTVEWTSTSLCTPKAIAASAPASGAGSDTSLIAGDRLIVIPRAANAGGGWGGNGVRTASFCWDGAAAGVNEFSVTFTETLTFNADTATTTREQLSQGVPWERTVARFFWWPSLPMTPERMILG